MDIRAAEKMLRESGKAQELMNAVTAEEGRRLESLIDKDAVRAAVAEGDPAKLAETLRAVLNTGEGRALAEKISEIMKK